MDLSNSKEFRDALITTDVEYSEIGNNDRKEILNKIQFNYVDTNEYKYPLWDNLKDKISVDYKFSWEWFTDILREKQIVLFFDQYDDNNMFLLNEGSDVVKVLNNCFKFTFYITDINADFIFCYNEHDYLIAQLSVVCRVGKCAGTKELILQKQRNLDGICWGFSFDKHNLQIEIRCIF